MAASVLNQFMKDTPMQTPKSAMAANPILVTGAAGSVGSVGRKVTEQLLKQGNAVRAMVRREDDRAQALRRMGADVVTGDLLDLIR